MATAAGVVSKNNVISNAIGMLHFVAAPGCPSTSEMEMGLTVTAWQQSMGSSTHRG
jgi:hypothetical protein